MNVISAHADDNDDRLDDSPNEVADHARLLPHAGSQATVAERPGVLMLTGRALAATWSRTQPPTTNRDVSGQEDASPGHDARRGPGNAPRSPGEGDVPRYGLINSTCRSTSSSATQLSRMFCGVTPQTFFPISVSVQEPVGLPDDRQLLREVVLVGVQGSGATTSCSSPGCWRRSIASEYRPKFDAAPVAKISSPVG